MTLSAVIVCACVVVVLIVPNFHSDERLSGHQVRLLREIVEELHSACQKERQILCIC